MIKKFFTKISIKIASSSKIMEWSFGEVKTMEFINSKNFKPEKNGLFCLNIFSDYELCCDKAKCLCNRHDKYLNLKKAHINYKMGHIKLYYPVIHFWYMKSIPNNISNIIGLSYKIIEKISNFRINIVIKSYDKKIKKKFLTILNKDYRVYTMSGSKAIKYLLSDKEIIIDCSLIKKKIKKCESYNKLFFYLERINKIYIFYISGNKPSWLVISFLPVIPPRMRPLIPLSIGKFASSDINELYKRILSRNLKLKKMIRLGTPKSILVNDRILLQETVYSLFDNEKLKNPSLSSSKRILKSFSSSIKGKYGRFRQNLLGKRVDFSGRTVITVDPNIFLYECVIPILIALELFKPFLYYELKKLRLIETITFFDNYYKKNKKYVIKILNKIVSQHTVILNRAPTLHRMGLQSFKILLSEDKTIKIHPLMCLSYNADFDGDQMAIHLPLTILSQIESEFLLLSVKNIISPSNGEPIIIPTQDIVMGIYYLTYNFNIFINNIFTLVNILIFYNKNHSNFKYNILYLFDNLLIKTTIGRVIFSLTLLNKVNITLINKIIKKKTLTYIIRYLYEFCNLKELIIILEKIKKIGFFFSTYCGISIHYYDLIDIKNKYYLKKIFNKLFKKKNIFKIIESFNKIFLNIVLKKLYFFKLNKKINNLFIMLDSGSRGSLLQIKQLLLFRGFISKSSGEIILDPILENLKNGLNIKSYFISTFGARKGLTDTSLKTANSGYLTRKLIDVMHDLVIYKIDCYTINGLEIFIYDYNLIDLHKKIYGRIILKDIMKNNKIIILRNTIISNKIIYLILKLYIKEILIRSVIYCNSLRGVCCFCYGIDLSTYKLVLIGTPIGIISAQSIGEPGTQLTMRTFHTGGVASYSYNEENLVIFYSGFFKIKNCKCVLNFKNRLISLSLTPTILIKKKNRLESYKLLYGDCFPFRNGIFIKNNTKLLNFNDTNFYIYSENKGYILFKKKNLILEFCINDKKFYYKTLKNTTIVIKHKIIKKYFLPKNFYILYKNNDYILPGTKIAKILNLEIIRSNIIGGLPRLSELFEARIPNKKSIISEIDGIINIKINKKNFVIKIISKYGFYKLHIINFLRKLYVNNGDYVKMGDIITDGKPDLNDIIKYIGLEFLLSYFVNEINSIYVPQGIYINEKHLELVLKQMIKKVNILYSGECVFHQNNVLFFEDVLVENFFTLKKNKNFCLYERLVIGITKVSLDSLSFFSAASFQETSKVLVDSAIRNRTDYLLGLKENVVVGKLIPAGTGLLYHFCNFKRKNEKKTNLKKNLKLYLY